MKKRSYIEKNKAIIYSAIVSLGLVILIPIFAKNQTDRFALIMPIIAGWIFFNILALPDK